MTPTTILIPLYLEYSFRINYWRACMKITLNGDLYEDYKSRPPYLVVLWKSTLHCLHCLAQLLSWTSNLSNQFINLSLLFIGYLQGWRRYLLQIVRIFDQFHHGHLPQPYKDGPLSSFPHFQLRGAQTLTCLDMPHLDDLNDLISSRGLSSQPLH